MLQGNPPPAESLHHPRIVDREDIRSAAAEWVHCKCDAIRPRRNVYPIRSIGPYGVIVKRESQGRSPRYVIHPYPGIAVENAIQNGSNIGSRNSKAVPPAFVTNRICDLNMGSRIRYRLKQSLEAPVLLAETQKLQQPLPTTNPVTVPAIAAQYQTTIWAVGLTRMKDSLPAALTRTMQK